MPLRNQHLLVFRISLHVLILSCGFSPASAQNDSVGVSASSKKSKKVLYGQASFYSNKFHGRKTANGEIFSQDKFTAACNVLPLGTMIRVTNLKNGKTVVLSVITILFCFEMLRRNLDILVALIDFQPRL